MLLILLVLVLVLLLPVLSFLLLFFSSTSYCCNFHPLIHSSLLQSPNYHYCYYCNLGSMTDISSDIDAAFAAIRELAQSKV